MELNIRLNIAIIHVNWFKTFNKYIDSKKFESDIKLCMYVILCQFLDKDIGIKDS